MTRVRAAMVNLALAAALAGPAVLTGATPAAADEARFTDAKRDILASVDIERVHVVNGFDQGRKVQVVVKLRNLKPGDVVVVWLDTKAREPGPEFRVQSTANSGDLNVYAVDRWSDDGTVVACDGLRVRMNGLDPSDRARFRIPRICLGDPGAVRVSVNSSRLTHNGWQNDWAPRYRHWYPRVPGPATP